MYGMVAAPKTRSFIQPFNAERKRRRHLLPPSEQEYDTERISCSCEDSTCGTYRGFSQVSDSWKGLGCDRWRAALENAKDVILADGLQNAERNPRIANRREQSW